jgi:hypothetical protein
MSHDHSVGLGKLRVETREILRMVEDGTITPQVLRRALEQLRYLGVSMAGR